MSYRVTSGHVESLHDGRMVGPGEDVTGVNPRHPHDKRLIEVGALTKRPDKRSKKETGRYAGLKQPKLIELLDERGIERPKGRLSNAKLIELLEEADKASEPATATDAAAPQEEST